MVSLRGANTIAVVAGFYAGRVWKTDAVCSLCLFCHVIDEALGISSRMAGGSDLSNTAVITALVENK